MHSAFVHTVPFPFRHVLPTNGPSYVPLSNENRTPLLLRVSLQLDLSVNFQSLHSYGSPTSCFGSVESLSPGPQFADDFFVSFPP
jgi:hypothetical protein